MSRFLTGKKKIVSVAAFLVLLFAGTVAWVERTPLLAWYYVRGLTRASERDREVWVERVVGLDTAALPGLVRCLFQDDARICANVQAALARMSARWPREDQRWTGLALELSSGFGRMSPSGQQAVLLLHLDWVGNDSGAAPAPILETATRLVHEATHGSGKEARLAALRLAVALVTVPGQPELLEQCQEAARDGLRDAEPEIKVQAVHLAQYPPLSMLEQVVPLLHDPSAEVRRAAILAVGPSQNAINSEDLLPWLHDPDADVRRLCEDALLGRNVPKEDLHLGRLVTDPSHAVRSQAIVDLQADAEREPAEWLRRLSYDPVPSVRLAAIRAATQRPHVDLSDRIQQMTRSDPSPTVCQLARYYLSCQKRQ